MSKVIDNIEDIASIDNHIGLSGITAYHLLQGNLAVDNTVTTQGFNTTLYTGNGSTQSINTGIDMSTQWGNDVSEKFGGLVWLKSRSNVSNNHLYDTIRGSTKYILSNTTDSQITNANTLTAFNSNGFNVGSDNTPNTNAGTYASWNFQTTHRVSGTTNHGKAYTCHFNPFTGFTIVKYEGSGIAGHEIPHHLGRKLGFNVIKDISVVGDWRASYLDSGRLRLNATAGTEATDSTVAISTDTMVSVPNTLSNTSTNQHILYGWANSYLDESNKLIGNYEVGVYQGTGASGNKVVTRGKPAWLMIKRLDSSTGSWAVYNNQSTASNFLCPNLSQAESSGQPLGAFNNDGFTINNTSWSDVNASGGQYLYMVAYDTNSNGGGSYYPRATDTSNLQVQNAIIPFANGVDGNGSKITTLSKNETISGLTLTAGKNYVYSKNDGTYGVSKYAPQYGTYNGFGDYFDVNTNKWYSGISVFSDDFSDGNTDGWFSSNGATLSASTYSLKVTNNGTSFGEALITVSNLKVGQKYAYIGKYNNITTSQFTARVYDSVTNVFQDGGMWWSSYGMFNITFIATNSVMKIATVNFNINNAIALFDNIAVYPINNDGSVDLSSATPITGSRNYLNHIVYADNDGSPLYVEELPKTVYFDELKFNNLAYNVDTSSFIANTLASGAIIERGSNANGEYTKFADGTLICRKIIQITYNSNTFSNAFQMPIQSVGGFTYSCAGSVNGDGNGKITSIRCGSVTNFSIVSDSVGSVIGTFDVTVGLWTWHITATGKWK